MEKYKLLILYQPSSFSWTTEMVSMDRITLYKSEVLLIFIFIYQMFLIELKQVDTVRRNIQLLKHLTGRVRAN